MILANMLPVNYLLIKNRPQDNGPGNNWGAVIFFIAIVILAVVIGYIIKVNR